MVERLKRWESPRKRGRNDKGKGGAARARQLRKREQMLRQKLKNSSELKPKKQAKRKRDQQRDLFPSVFFCNTDFQVYIPHLKNNDPRGLALSINLFPS